MREIKFDTVAPSLKSPSKWDSSFIEFVNSCLIKDPKVRPDAEAVLKINKKFFALCKDKKYLRDNLLKDVPSVQDRVKLFKIKNLFLYFN
jgi:serine/threonine protein kinase